MKIACMIDGLGSGGAQRQLVNLAGLWKREGNEILFLVYHDIPFFSGLLHSFGIVEEVVSASTKVRLVLNLRKRLALFNPDVVISFLDSPNFITAIASIGCRWRFVANELSAKENAFCGLNKLLKYAMVRADAIVCNSQNAFNMWKLHFPMFSNKLSVIYNPVVIRDETALMLNKESSDRKHIVITASYQYLKNPVELVKGVGLLDDEERSQISISWYGNTEVSPGDTRAFDEASTELVQLGLEETISLNEATNDIYPIIASADVVGLFSTVEGLPNAVCEGMLFGKPILMTPVSDYEILVGSENGFVTKGFAAQDIADGLRLVIQSSDLDLQRMGKISKEKASRMFDANSVCASWIELFKTL